MTRANGSSRAKGLLTITVLVATVSLVTEIVINLIAPDLLKFLEPFHLWIWLAFALTVIATIIMAIITVRHKIITDTGDQPQPPEGHNTSDIRITDGTVYGDVVGRDKITQHIHNEPLPPPSLHQLPSPPLDFTGRTNALDELMHAITSEGATITSIYGMGGVGKTALALKLAAQITPLYPDAQLFLDLCGATSAPMTVAEAMARVIHTFYPEVKLPDNDDGLRDSIRRCCRKGGLYWC